jgi:hypothetical protein
VQWKNCNNERRSPVQENGFTCHIIIAVLVARETNSVYLQGFGVLDLWEALFGDHPAMSIVGCELVMLLCAGSVCVYGCPFIDSCQTLQGKV